TRPSKQQSDYDAQSAVERELVLRLASLLWRLRRATLMETGLFEIQADQLREYRQSRPLLPKPIGFTDAVPGRPDLEASVSTLKVGTDASTPVEFAQCFLRLANMPNCALDRLSRYEAMLSRQAGRILFALETLDRRKPQERNHRSTIVSLGG